MKIVKEMKWLFSDDDRLRSAFHAIKVDMDLVNENHDSLKKSTNDWIVFLDQENHDLKARVKELEDKLSGLEQVYTARASAQAEAADEQELSLLRSV